MTPFHPYIKYPRETVVNASQRNISSRTTDLAPPHDAQHSKSPCLILFAIIIVLSRLKVQLVTIVELLVLLLCVNSLVG